CIQGVQLPLTF
nr:immunoglobulin light chain junction region [Macaca mulatta]